MFNENEASRSVVRCGDGCGFLVNTSKGRYIVTAAHCLPHIPEPLVDESRIHRQFVGPVDEPPAITVKCVFVDPVSDIAVLTAPDRQALPDDAIAYDAFVRGRWGFLVESGSEEIGWLIQNGSWFVCRLTNDRVGLSVSESSRPIIGRMSGSPILNESGAAIGLLTNSASSPNDIYTEGGPTLRLKALLPGWFLSGLDDLREDLAYLDYLDRRDFPRKIIQAIRDAIDRYGDSRFDVVIEGRTATAVQNRLGYRLTVLDKDCWAFTKDGWRETIEPIADPKSTARMLRSDNWLVSRNNEKSKISVSIDGRSTRVYAIPADKLSTGSDGNSDRSWGVSVAGMVDTAAVEASTIGT